MAMNGGRRYRRPPLGLQRCGYHILEIKKETDQLVFQTIALLKRLLLLPDKGILLVKKVRKHNSSKFENAAVKQLLIYFGFTRKLTLKYRIRILKMNNIDLSKHWYSAEKLVIDFHANCGRT